ncbi:expressed unknown protein [Seminavis robusta]|uniref:Uncharacterized protein n=1 Tax=Seminavis robusta TaxID=568900 RepID=A0A9N8F2N6_9STRA|nr:expressed unknown protein [Seminavis robusta]|eukprot:Sro2882_g339290.1 n/a (169) ;mRNA; r:10067-10640
MKQPTTLSPLLVAGMTGTLALSTTLEVPNSMVAGGPFAKAIHEQFEADVCDCLVQSNTKTFAHAHDCKIDYFVHFPDSGPILKSVDVQPVKKVKAEKHHDGQDVVKMGTMVTIDGTSNAPAGSHSSEKHAPILSKCMTESYGNQMGYTLESFEVNKEIDVKKDEEPTT